MKVLAKHKFTLLFFLSISFIYFVIRLPNLTLQPIFADEAIYVRWAQIMRAEPTLRFLPLSDGKTPLFMWVLMPFFKFFSDPLLAGRFLSVISGFASLIGVFVLGWIFFNRRVGLWSAALLTLTPFTFFFDRMALVDSMLTAFSIWSLVFALLLIRWRRLDLAMILGYFLGGGLLTKTPAMFNLIALPATLLIFDWKDKARQKKLLQIIGLWVVAIIITFTVYSILKLGPGFDNLSSRNQDYIFSPLELVGRPLDPFIPRLRDLADWFPKLIKVPVILLILFSVGLAFLVKNKYALAVLIWSITPLLIEMAFLKTFTARYILSSIPPLLVLSAFGVDFLIERVRMKKIFLYLATSVFLFLIPVKIDLTLLTAPENVDLPRSERSGYFEAWTAGYGFPEIANFLIDEAKNGTVVVGTEGFFGTLPDGLMIYLDSYDHLADKDHQVVVLGSKIPISDDVREQAGIHPTFFVANNSRFEGEEKIELIAKYPKAKGPGLSQDAILFYRVLPGGE